MCYIRQAYLGKITEDAVIEELSKTLYKKKKKKSNTHLLFPSESPPDEEV